MPKIPNQDEVSYLINAWQTALPSQVIDSFYQSNTADFSLERIMAFEIDQDDLKTLTADQGSHLEADYGFDQRDLGGKQSAFKMLLRAVNGTGKEKSYSKYYSMKSLTAKNIHHDYPGVIKKSLLTHMTGNNVVTPIDSKEVPNEYISPTIEQWLFYAWRHCETSKLVDQVEAMYKGFRERIRKSTFDASVSQAVNKYENDNNESTIYTFVLLALHQVIPGDMRIFHFGPILLSFAVPAGQELISMEEAPVLKPESYELTVPCPPLCQE